MNSILNDYLHCFILVFVDNILIYISSWTEHLQHVCAVFQLLREHRHFLEMSKCSFGEEEVAYLGHIIFVSDVSMDPTKVEVDMV